MPSNYFKHHFYAEDNGSGQAKWARQTSELLESLGARVVIPGDTSILKTYNSPVGGDGLALTQQQVNERSSWSSSLYL